MQDDGADLGLRNNFPAASGKEKILIDKSRKRKNDVCGGSTEQCGPSSSTKIAHLSGEAGEPDSQPYCEQDSCSSEAGKVAIRGHERDSDNDTGKRDEDSACERLDDNDDSGSRANSQPSVRICLVCGDRASGYNFNALSCESCKAFFRRNAMKSDVGQCLFSRNCKIELHTRRFCTACRLDKCLQVGMKRSMILNDVEKEKRRAKVIENRQSRAPKVAPSFNSDSNQSTSQPSNASSVKIPAEIPAAEPVVVAAVSSGEVEVQSNVACNARDVKPTSVAVSVASGDFSTAVVYVASCTSGSEQSSENDSLDKRVNRRVLTDEEWRFVSSLRSFYEEAFIAAEQMDELPHPNTTLNALVNVAGFLVRKLIRFAKRVVDFQILRQASQIALLKGAVVDTVYLRSAFHYDAANDCWSTIHGRVRADILKQALARESLSGTCDVSLSHSLYEEHFRFARTLQPLLDNDLNIVTLLQLITLFSPDRPAISHSYVPRAVSALVGFDPSQQPADAVLTATEEQMRIANIQDKFVILLKHYLEAKYSLARSRTLLVQIMQKLDELNELSEVHGRVLLFADPSQIEPLMLEVFDLLATR